MAQHEHTLATRLSYGEESAFAELYDACADRLHRYLVGRLGSVDRAADVVQTTFVRAVQNRRRFAGVDNPMAYLFQMAHNEAIRAIKREHRSDPRRLAADKLKEAGENHCPLDDADVATAALARLAAEDREVIELKIFGGFTFAEIAQVTGCPAATMATRYRRALESLRPWLVRQLQ